MTYQNSGNSKNSHSHQPPWVFCLILLITFSTTLIYGQPNVSAEESLFYEKYTLEHNTYFLLPDSTSPEDMTEWDWIEMTPKTEVRTHTRAIDQEFSLFERIDILENSNKKDWHQELKHLVIDQEGTTAYNDSGMVISYLPHSESHLTNQSTLVTDFQQNGLTPQTPFPNYEELSIEDLEGMGFNIDQTANGYIMSNGTEEISINIDQLSCTRRIFNADFGLPHYENQRFILSDQGYMIPLFKRSLTRQISENGHCIVKVEIQSFKDQDLHYDPTILEQENSDISNSFAIFPNPASDFIEIKYVGASYPSSPYDISIKNHLGEIVMEQSELNTENQEIIELSQIPDGYYIMHFTIDNNHFTKNLIK